MTIIDTIIIIFILLMTTHGFYQGFIRSLAEPITILAALTLSYLVFILTRNIIAMIVISIPARFAFSWLINLGIRTWCPPLDFSETSLFTRMGGMTVNFISSSALSLIIIAVLAIAPLDQFELENVRKNIYQTQTLSLIKPWLVQYGLIPKDETLPSSCLGDLCNMTEADADTLAADAQIQDIMNDPRIQKLLHDPITMTAIEKRDLKTLFTNPIIAELTSDPSFLIKALQASAKLKKLGATHSDTTIEQEK